MFSLILMMNILALSSSLPTIHYNCKDVINNMENIIKHGATVIKITSSNECPNFSSDWLRFFSDNDYYKKLQSLSISGCTTEDLQVQELVGNLHKVRCLTITDSLVKRFDFSWITSTELELDLSHNPNINLEGKSNVKLTKFACENCNLQNVDILKQFKDHLKVLNLLGNQISSDFWSNFPSLIITPQTTTDIPFKIKPNASNSSSGQNATIWMFVGWLAILTARRNTSGFMVSLLCFAAIPMFTNGLPIDLDKLSIRGQDIPHLTISYFDTANTNITYLDVANNGIMYVDYMAISKFQSLECLDLSGNHLSRLGVYGPSVISISLSNNKINSIGNELFESLPNLRYINLEGNLLVDINLNLSFHLSLQTLIFSRNPLQSVTLLSATLKTLILKECSNSLVRLSGEYIMPNLEFLEITDSHVDSNLDLCKLSRNEFSIRKAYDTQICPEIVDAEKLMADSGDYMTYADDNGNDKVNKIKDRVGCDYSTLKANFGDIILTPNEFNYLLYSFAALSITVFVLIALKLVLVYMYCIK